MKKTRLIIVPINSLRGHAALALIRKHGKGEFRKIPVDYKETKTELPTGLEEDGVLILGYNGRLAKLALREGISLPRAVARFITKNEETATVSRFLRKIEKVLASTAATKNFQGAVKNLLKTFEPAVAVRGVTGLVERIFSLSNTEINNGQFSLATYGLVRVATVKKGILDPFVASQILAEGKADISIQETITGLQISRAPKMAGVVDEITHSVRRQGMTLGDGRAPKQTGNTFSFTKQLVMENQMFPTIEAVLAKTAEVCENWSKVSEKELVALTAE